MSGRWWLGAASLAARGAALLCALSVMAPPAAAAAVEVHVSNDGRALGNAAVYAVPLDASALPPPKDAVIDQVNRQFVPFLTVVQTGTAIHFPNHDNIRHQVYSFSPPKTFLLKLYSGTPAQPVIFDKPGAVSLGCYIHDQMLAYVYVVDTPYFAVSGRDGRAVIENLPAGRYTVKVWHPWLSGVEPAMTYALSAADRPRADIALTLANPPPRAAPPEPLP